MNPQTTSVLAQMFIPPVYPQVKPRLPEIENDPNLISANQKIAKAEKAENMRKLHEKNRKKKQQTISNMETEGKPIQHNTIINNRYES